MDKVTMNQRVGILTGIALFIGSLMTAYYGNKYLWAWVTVVSLSYVVWAQSRSWNGKTIFDVAWAGFVFGMSAALVARVIALVIIKITLGVWWSSVVTSDSLDMFRFVLAGDIGQTLRLLSLAGILSAVIAAGSVWTKNKTNGRA